MLPKNSVLALLLLLPGCQARTPPAPQPPRTLASELAFYRELQKDQAKAEDADWIEFREREWRDYHVGIKTDATDDAPGTQAKKQVKLTEFQRKDLSRWLYELDALRAQARADGSEDSLYLKERIEQHANFLVGAGEYASGDDDGRSEDPGDRDDHR